MAIFSNRRECGSHHTSDLFINCRSHIPDCTNKWISKIVIALIFAVMLIILLFIFQPFRSETNILVINMKDPILHETDPHFLSVALDSSLIADKFYQFNMSNIRLHYLMKPLRGGYLRVGGIMADRLIFNESGIKHKFNRYYTNCEYESLICKPEDRPIFTMSGNEWTSLNELAAATGLMILFDLNCLLRMKDGSWNSSNAEELIHFSNEKQFDLMWELGNEPNAYKHVFNNVVNATQLAKDFKKLRQILNKYPRYKNSLLVGPDITRPRTNHKETIEYLIDFLKESNQTVNAITWHQYYFNGKTAILYNFIDPEVFNILQKQITAIKNAVKLVGYEKTPIWLGETSSAYGGGAPGFSDRFISTFIWLDKLGLAAKNGLDVVVRQSLFKGNYALINNHYEPTPDWWLTVIFKLLVGNKVVDCAYASPPEVRLYCHCNANNPYSNSSAITVFGVNMKNSEAIIRIQESNSRTTEVYEIQSFILQTHFSVLSSYIFLNDEMLYLKHGKMPYIQPKKLLTNTIGMPPFSLGFWIIPSQNFIMCN